MKSFQQVLLVNGLAFVLLALAMTQAAIFFLPAYLSSEQTMQASRWVARWGVALGFAGLVLLVYIPRLASRSRRWMQILEPAVIGASFMLLLAAFYRQNHVLQSVFGLVVLLAAIGLVVFNVMSSFWGRITTDGSKKRVAYAWEGLRARYMPVINALGPLLVFIFLISLLGVTLGPVELVVASVVTLAFTWVSTTAQHRDLQMVEHALESFLMGQRVERVLRPQSLLLARLFPSINRLGGAESGSRSVRDLWLQELAEAAASEERNRLARELHDSIKQQIFSIKMSAAATDARWESDRPGARKSLGDVRSCAHQAMVEMQALLLQLRPEALANTGLVEALKEQCEALEYRSGAKVRFEVQHLPDESELPPTTQQNLFRIAQEALSNVSRHARASQVTVRLWQDEQHLYLGVEDNGQGFEVEAVEGGFGLQGMQERLEALAGSLELHSAPGEGTRLLVQVPLIGEESLEVAASETIEPVEKGTATSGSERFFSPAVVLGLCAAWLPGITPNSLYEPDEEKLLSGTLLCALLAAALISYGWHRWRHRRSDRAQAGDSVALQLRLFLLLSVAYWWTPKFWWVDSRQDLEAILGSLALSLVLAGLSTVALFRAVESAFSRWDYHWVLLIPWLLTTVASTAIVFFPYSWKLVMLAMAGGLMTSGLYLGFVALVWVEHRPRPGAGHEA